MIKHWYGFGPTSSPPLTWCPPFRSKRRSALSSVFSSFNGTLPSSKLAARRQYFEVSNPFSECCEFFSGHIVIEKQIICEQLFSTSEYRSPFPPFGGLKSPLHQTECHNSTLTLSLTLGRPFPPPDSHPPEHFVRREFHIRRVYPTSSFLYQKLCPHEDKPRP